ncbi:AEC family transporter [Chiayiivirga sp.]|uniref:AEC family transporter n=1 Tax=Chiayiivirga sp. TaxID=2041042 RepID=UPI0025BB87C1|nr:AEC family transporter [Chiayiivirga sp.]
MDALIFVLLMLVLGKACARWRVLPENTAEALNAVVLYLCLPAAVLRYAPQLQVSPQVAGVVAVPWLLLALSAGLIAGLGRVLSLREDERGVLLLCVPLGNTSFLGYPLTEALLGPAALPYAVIYDQFGSFLMLSTWGLWVLARYGGDARPTVRDIARRLLRFPPFIALAFALSLMPAEPPVVIGAILQRLSDALLPLVALAVGLSLKFRLPRDELVPLGLGLALKLVLMPLAAWALVQVFAMPSAMGQASVLESAMPPMITAGALAISHRLAPGLAAALVGYGTVLALLSLPLWHALLR